LQKLLQLQTHKKLNRQKELAKAERLRRMEEAHLAMLQERIADELKHLAASKKDRLNVNRLRQSTHYQDRLVVNMATQRQVISDAKRTEALRRRELLGAAKEEKILLKLRERQEFRYLKELDSLEQKETDETAKTVTNRQQSRPAS